MIKIFSLLALALCLLFKIGHSSFLGDESKESIDLIHFRSCPSQKHACDIVSIKVDSYKSTRFRDTIEAKVLTDQLKQGTIVEYTFDLFWEGRHVLYGTEFLDEPSRTGDVVEFSFDLILKSFLPPGQYTLYVTLFNDEGVSAACAQLDFIRTEEETFRFQKL